MSPKGAVVFLQVMSGLIVGLGTLGMLAALIAPRMVAVFGVQVPLALVAMMIMGVGAYYWNRASKLKAKVISGNVL